MNIPFLHHEQKKLGIVMHGGGMRTVAYAGVLKALEENGIKVSFLVGASGGAVVAGSYASGASPERILQHYIDFKPLQFSFDKLREGHILDYEKWIEHAKKMVGEIDLMDMKIKLWIQILDATTGVVRYFDKGPAAQLVITSSALPVAVGPLEYEGHQMLDGDIDPGRAVDLLRENGAEVVIRLGTSKVSKGGFLDKLLRPFTILQELAYKREQKLHPADITIGNLGRGHGMFDTSASKQMYDEGYKTASKKIGKLKELLY